MAYIPCPNCERAPRERDYAAHVAQCRRIPGGMPIGAKVTADQRKMRPVFSGVLQYFPDALLEVARCSWVGNEQHNPGLPLHWDRSKSTDEADALVRHLMQAGTVDTDGVLHTAKVAWRALALLQKEIEAGRQSSPDATGDSISPEPWGDLF
jgi:hypothetical protein